MVRLSAALLRVPVIKFRKGGLGRSGGHAPAAAASPMAKPSASASCAFRPAAAPGPAAPQMSTSAIPDIDLPARYRRKPLSDEEIDQINGGGIADPPKPAGKK
ncbi:uncharacterized protein LOC125230494 isoform X2 [Leguminivora glycinivorella]|uniref:uncharacterized protein LOC125230494 isoform X2 n=1 Tax=Leguminivora glycinivorella TaxID=1035111 RepID=UPI00200C236C|nr:uncharacterized protein LOC125230494 isoform X2 [Leguminivora glycinivorella]XP_047991619.1 uncharacterized protein LOC125230494 isoform X2 [Leguminivora glycinivorella]